MGHCNSLYLPSLHVPLILAMPGRVPENTRVSTPVSLRNLAHTVMAMVDPDGAVEFPGDSWLRFLE